MFWNAEGSFQTAALLSFLFRWKTNSEQTSVFNYSTVIALRYNDSPLYLGPFSSNLWAWISSDQLAEPEDFWGGIRESVWLKSRRNELQREDACSNFMAFPDTTQVSLSNDRLFIGQNHLICTFLLTDTMEMTSTRPACRPRQSAPTWHPEANLKHADKQSNSPTVSSLLCI